MTTIDELLDLSRIEGIDALALLGEARPARLRLLPEQLLAVLAGLDFVAYPAFRCRVGADGAFEGGVQTLGLAEDGVGYALDDYNRALVPEAVVSELETVRESIVSGETVVTDFRTQ